MKPERGDLIAFAVLCGVVPLLVLVAAMLSNPLGRDHIIALLLSPILLTIFALTRVLCVSKPVPVEDDDKPLSV